jgi:zinc/manganese transport system substrate-binding protein
MTSSLTTFPFSALLLLLALVSVTSCSKTPQSEVNEYVPDKDKQYKVIVSSMLLAELVVQLGGDAVSVECLGVSKDSLAAKISKPPTSPVTPAALDPTAEPEVKPVWAPNPFKLQLRANDLFTMQTAHLVILNGLGVEKQLEPQVEKLRAKGVVVEVIGDAIPEDQRLKLPDGTLDPCYWNSPKMMLHAIDAVTAGLQKIAPEAAMYFSNLNAPVMDKMKRLAVWGEDKLSQSRPPGKRFLFTSHNSLGYFGRDYGVETRSLWNTADGAELAQTDPELIAWLEKNQVSDFVLDISTPATFSALDLKHKFHVNSTIPVYTIYPDRPGTVQLGKLERLDVGTYEGAFQQLIRVVERKLGGTRQKSTDLPEGTEPAPSK